MQTWNISMELNTAHPHLMCLGSDVSDDRKIPKPSKWQSVFRKPLLVIAPAY